TETPRTTGGRVAIITVRAFWRNAPTNSPGTKTREIQTFNPSAALTPSAAARHRLGTASPCTAREYHPGTVNHPTVVSSPPGGKSRGRRYTPHMSSRDGEAFEPTLAQL